MRGGGNRIQNYYLPNFLFCNLSVPAEFAALRILVSRKRPYEHDTDYDPDESFIVYHDQDLADDGEFNQTNQDYR